MPISWKPCSQRDLSCFLTGHKGTQPFYLNFFWENCLLDVDFQQPLPSEKNIHGWCFTWNANRIKLNSLHSISSCFMHIQGTYIILEKTVYGWACTVAGLIPCVLQKKAGADPSRWAGSQKKQGWTKIAVPGARQSSFGTSSNIIPDNFCQAAPESASQPAHLLAALFSLFK